MTDTVDTLTDVPCALCRSTDTTPVCVKFGLPIARCVSCGLVRATPRCSAERIHARYSAAYFWNEYLPSLGVVDGQVDETLLAQRYAPWIALVTEAVGPRGALLDVGCGAGLFARAFARAGWSVIGAEVNDEGVRFARTRLGLDVRQQPLEGLDLEPGVLDVVTMMDVLEHVPDPAAAVSAARRLLRPGGILLLQTPNLHALSHTVLGTPWAVLSPAEHLYYFTETTLAALLTRAGFTAVDFTWAFPGFGPAETMNARYTHAPDAWSTRAYAAAVRVGGSRLLRWVQAARRTDQLIAVAHA